MFNKYLQFIITTSMLHNYTGEKVPLFTQGHAGRGGWLADGLEGDLDTGLV